MHIPLVHVGIRDVQVRHAYLLNALFLVCLSYMFICECEMQALRVLVVVEDWALCTHTV